MCGTNAARPFLVCPPSSGAVLQRAAAGKPKGWFKENKALSCDHCALFNCLGNELSSEEQIELEKSRDFP